MLSYYKNKKYKQELVSSIDKNKNKKQTYTNKNANDPIFKIPTQKTNKNIDNFLPFVQIEAGWSHTCGKSLNQI